MNDPVTRKRVIWIAAGGGVLILCLLFITAFAPSSHPGVTDPVIRPADTAATASATPEASSGGGFSLTGGDAVSLAWRLGLVVVIIAGSIVALRWWGRRASGPRSTTGYLRVLDTLAISNGRTIHLVALGERVIAIGATAQQLTCLSELNEDESRAVIALAPDKPGAPIADFAAELFQSVRGQAGGRGRRQVIASAEELE